MCVKLKSMNILVNRWRGFEVVVPLTGLFGDAANRIELVTFENGLISYMFCWQDYTIQNGWDVKLLYPEYEYYV